MIIDIVGEDDVTRAIIEKAIKVYRGDLIIGSYRPARGGKIKKIAPVYKSLNSPFIVLTDLDNYSCPPELITDWFGKTTLNKQYLFRIAYREAESWLMADRRGFSKWLGVKIDLIPESQIIDKRKNIFELEFPYKPSLYMMREIVPRSSKKEMIENLSPKEGARKGPAYNSSIIPFIKNIWDIENASNNSYSLKKTIERIMDY
jgi:hypothetical protein